MPILCVLSICANLATAHGSFLVNGWRVWNNASVAAQAHVETETVPVKISLPARQNLWIGAASSVRIKDRTILLEKGCALLDSSGAYSLDAKSVDTAPCGSKDVIRQYETLREYRPMSQRP